MARAVMQMSKGARTTCALYFSAAELIIHAGADDPHGVCGLEATRETSKTGCVAVIFTCLVIIT